MELVKKSSTTLKSKTDWTPDHETILVEWADKAMCYRWLHKEFKNISMASCTR